MAKLVIVESPAKAGTIARYLGKGYVVKASMGHVRDLPSKEIGVDVDSDFEPRYEVLAKARKVVSTLKKAAARADEVFMATDLDREGEAIAWHLVQALNLPDDRVRRVVFNEITRSAVKKAFAEPMPIDMGKVNAQQARRILDRIVGYELSPLLWRKVLRGLSAGRVQSVAVRLVVEREREVEAFKPVEYWEIAAVLRPEAAADDEDSEFTAKLAKVGGEDAVVGTEAETQALLERLEKADFVVAEVKTRRQTGRPSPPFTTSTMQQQASTQLRFRPRKTMAIAQQLYEGVDLGGQGSDGLITYMRTDSTRVSAQAIGQVREMIRETFGSDYLPEKPNAFRQRKRAQAAHEAIRPTSAARTPASVKEQLSRDQFRLYELIWKRFVASQMAASKRDIINLEIAADDTLFTAEGKHLVFDGHERVTGLRARDAALPPLAKGDALRTMQLTPSQHFTEPPARYTEASLIRALERLGIGRPSTYAPIISTIQQRNYVRPAEGKLRATELGKLVTDELLKHFADLINVDFTSQMEEQLDEVEEGQVEWHEVLRRFYAAFEKDLEEARENMERVPGRQVDEKCPKCNKPLKIRSSRYGLFFGCSGYPECDFTRPFEDGPDEQQEETTEVCDKCGKPMVVRRSRRGKFLGCSGYPECRNTKSLDGGPASGSETDIKCEKCGQPMVIRRGRRGVFLGCSGYPKCRNTMPMPKEDAPAGDKGKTEGSES